jgi:hypothetical protein
MTLKAEPILYSIKETGPEDELQNSSEVGPINQDSIFNHSKLRLKKSAHDLLFTSIKLCGVVNLGIGESIIDY